MDIKLEKLKNLKFLTLCCYIQMFHNLGVKMKVA